MAAEYIKYGFIRAQSNTSKRYLKKFAKTLYFIDDEIFHYTDINGLKGILESRGFWLSEAQFLNDAEEIYNGVNIAKLLIEKLLTKKRYSIFHNILINTLSKLENSDFKHHYIASFSLKQDDLEQWRAYAKNGSGICIGFDPKAQTNYPHFPQSNIWSLNKVIYDDKVKIWILHSIIAEYFFEYKKDISEGFLEWSEYGYIESLAFSLSNLFILFKNKAFASEQEIRLVYTQEPLHLFNKKYYRNTKNVLVPYICTNDTKLKHNNGEKIEVDLLPISKIIVGPTINQDATIKSIKYFVQDIGYSTDIVQSSHIPYRG